MEPERETWLFEALGEACYAWDAYLSAKTPVEQADKLIRFNDRMFDLSTYHPQFDSNTGFLPYDEE